MESLLGLIVLFILFMLFLYPVIVANIKVSGVREQLHATVARVAALEQELRALRQQPAAPSPQPRAPPAPAVRPAAPTVVPRPAAPVDAFATLPVEPPAAVPDSPPAWRHAVQTWLLTGNVVAKFGLLILIIGIGFLVTYTAQRVTAPIELRLSGVVVADIALLLWGWRIRTARRDVALPVQGAALAIMMLVVFGAYQRYHVIPATLAFPMLVALTVLTCVLALLQDALWLAVFGIIGGFAAPLLVSTGSSNHIALFSYDALLNAGILALALRRSWRVLNVLGFACTFLIGGAWGLMQYTPEHYASAQAFLVLFFLFYVGIAVAWAGRRAPQFNDAVDATLVFGTPAAACAMQYGLVRHVPFGMAFSSLALSLFYLGLAYALHLRGRHRPQPLLVATCVALATVFGTLALPFALSGTWTSAAWALEGTGLIWVGLRQQRVLAWRFGLVVQAGAAIAFLLACSPPMSASSLALGGMLLAAAFGLTSWLFTFVATGHRPLGHVALAGAAVWWYGPALWGAGQLLARAGDVPVQPVYAMLVCASALSVVTAARKLAWPALRLLRLPVWVTLAGPSILLLGQLYARDAWPPAIDIAAWACAWGCGDFLLRRGEEGTTPDWWRKALHLLRIATPWLMLWPAGSRLIAGWLALDPAQLDLITLSGWRVSGSWAHFVPAWLMILAVFWLIARSRTGQWPTAPLAPWYRQVVIPAAACWCMLLALFWNLQQDGAMAPLPYLPLLNPLDLTTAFVLLLWMASYRSWGDESDARLPAAVALMPRIAAFATWGWLNMVLLRTAAHVTGIDYDLDALATSTVIQAMLSLWWSVSALFIMRRADRYAPATARRLWIAGAVLLGVVVIKLFLVDLSHSGGIARIVTFVGVGLLMVVIGYLAPYPAALKERTP